MSRSRRWDGIPYDLAGKNARPRGAKPAVTNALTHLALPAGRERSRIDVPAAQRAARDLLDALGVDLGDESLRDTPRRMAHMYAELLSPAPFSPTTFPNDGGYDELVVATEIPFHSLCEHHLLPFTGVAHVGYLPGDRILGLSKLARLVEHFAARPQVQERLTQQIADWLDWGTGRPGVGRGAGRRAHLHDHAGRAGCGRPDGDLGPARSAARQPLLAGGVLRPDRRPH
jgi:GTP cyclohydrolase IA